MCIKILHVFQRVKSIVETQAGISLECQNEHRRYCTFLSIQFFHKRIVLTHTYLIVCVRTLKRINVKETVCTSRSIVIVVEATVRA